MIFVSEVFKIRTVMDKSGLYYLEDIRCTIEELQEKLEFIFLPQIAFETNRDREEIWQRGLHKWKEGEVAEEALELGARFREKIETAYLPKVSVRWVSDTVEHGLFAEEKIAIGDYVGEYTGIVRKNDRRYTEPLNNYCYEYPVPDDIGRSFVIDATQGSLTRFINHSFRPNLKPIHVFFEGYYHLIFLATQEISKGEALSFNYGKNYWYVRELPVDL